MISRTLGTKLIQVHAKYPVTLLTGPRQSGKTTLCKAIFPDKPYISFENPDVQEFAENDPKGFLERYSKGAIFDEIQRCPKILSYIQGLVDEKKKNGMFVLTGSQNLLLLRSVQQSLAGRVAILKLLPFSHEEIQPETDKFSLEKLIFQGFYPRIYDQNLDPTNTMRYYVESYIERDVRQITNISNLSTFRKFIKLCAGRIGGILNLSSLGNDVGISHTTAKEWLSVLEASYIVYQLPAYYKSFNKRIIKSPKLYFTDVGLACYLLGIEKPEQVTRDPLFGFLFENLIITETLKYFYNSGKDAPLYFFRDNIGNEVDLIIEKARKVIGVEVKAGQTVNSDWFKGLNYLDKVMRESVLARHIIYGGMESYKRENTSVNSYQNFTNNIFV